MRDRPQPPPPRLDGLIRLQPLTQEDFLSTSAEDPRGSSPPYRPLASSSNINISSTDFPPTPAYTSTTRLHVMDQRTETESPLEDPDSRPNGSDIKGSSHRPTVHYPENLPRPPAEPAPGYTRTDSAPDVISSRASSIMTDDEDSEEFFDWSGEEDLVDEEAKFEERMGVKAKQQGWNLKRVITMLFSTLIGSTFLAGVLITPALLIQFYWYKPDPTPERRYIKDNVQAWLFWAAANLLISWYLALFVDIAPILSQFFISGFWGHVSESVKTQIERYDSVKDTLKPLLYAASGWASWIIIFGHIYNLFNTQNGDESRAHYTKRLEQVVEFGFFFALVMCAKRMLSHSIAFSFHRTAYKDRIDAVQEALEVIEKLREYRPKPAPRNAKSGSRTPVFSGLGFPSPFSEKEHFNFLSGALRSATPPGTRRSRVFEHDDGEDGDVEDGDKTLVGRKDGHGWKGKGKKRESSSWIHGEKPAKHGMDGSPVTDDDAVETRMKPITSSDLPFAESSSPHRYPPTPRHGSPRQSVEGSNDGGDTLIQAAKAIKSAVLHDARNLQGTGEGLSSITWNINSTHEAKRLARSIYYKFKDRRRTYLQPSDFYPAFPTHTDAEAAFRVFDKDNNGDISRGEIKATLVKVYKERRFLSRSMRDVGAALKTLDYIILFFAMVVLFFISLSVFGLKIGDSLTSVYSIGIAASFIFKNSASSAFDAIMFIFVTHPYDTGDRCIIDPNLVYQTVFARSDGTETYYFNSQLFTKFITNVRRSGKTFENLTMQVAWRTPLEKLDALEKSLNDWLSTEENRWFEPSTSIMLQSIEFQRYLTLTIGIAHNRYADWGLRWTRRTAFHAAVQYYCRELNITCFESPIPIVYADPESQTYRPSSPTSPSAQDTIPPITEQQRSEDAEEADRAAKTMQPVMGFLPPLTARASNLRARKSKSRKTVLRKMEG
ncbi:hypothetical protein BDZ94DRAFT_1279344 [Collybia nuda]|uniref:EF-hand domain-containing protein n=1 Tax=Collybia nuda TaxID=64659 RepID=A0A9P5YH34_9AGAR|nr:hypothetical protein BDZ94DRAFT_1279344 [Collybia nuda]